MFLSLCCLFTKYIVPDARCETETSLWMGANTKHCHSFFFPPRPVGVHSSSLFLHRLFLSLFRLAHPSSQTLLKPPFCLSKQISCKCSAFDFFPSTSWEKFPRKPVSFVAGVLSGSHWSAGNREHKGSRAGFKWGWEVVRLWRWEPVEPENHSQFHMCISVGISR